MLLNPNLAVSFSIADELGDEDDKLYILTSFLGKSTATKLRTIRSTPPCYSFVNCFPSGCAYYVYCRNRKDNG